MKCPTNYQPWSRLNKSTRMSTLRTIPTRRLLPGQKNRFVGLFFFPVGKWTDNGRGPPPFGGSSVVNHGESEPGSTSAEPLFGHLLMFKPWGCFFLEKKQLFLHFPGSQSQLLTDVAFFIFFLDMWKNHDQICWQSRLLEIFSKMTPPVGYVSMYGGGFLKIMSFPKNHHNHCYAVHLHCKNLFKKSEITSSFLKTHVVMVTICRSFADFMSSMVSPFSQHLWLSSPQRSDHHHILTEGRHFFRASSNHAAENRWFYGFERSHWCFFGSNHWQLSLDKSINLEDL